MADFILDARGKHKSLSGLGEPTEVIEVGPTTNISVYGKPGTFSVLREGDDAIVALGYTCRLGTDSMRRTLQGILGSFREYQVAELKGDLVGQFVLLIKKGPKVCAFTDLMGGRNIFYSSSGGLAGSSFSQMEMLTHTAAEDVAENKALEYLAVRHVLYPSLLGRQTINKKINWLYPFEYLVFDGDLHVGECVFHLENEKSSSPVLLADRLLHSLRKIISRGEFRERPVAVSLTGGRDSRLVAITAVGNFQNLRFRTAVSSRNLNSQRDMKVARKIAESCGVPLDEYRFRVGQDEELFIEATEGFVPEFNHAITPILNSAANYVLGLGGVFGTELFAPIASRTIDDHISGRVDNAKLSLQTDEGFWRYFRGEMEREFLEVKKHYSLSQYDERDYIRLFNLLNTARYGSFIMSAFNREGMQLEPYGQFNVLEVALSVAPELWGNHKTIKGDALIQKYAMSSLDRRVAKVITYSSFRPMLPFSASSAPMYLIGYGAQLLDWSKKRFKKARSPVVRTRLPWGEYTSNGWERPFVERLARKYGVDVRRTVA